MISAGDRLLLHLCGQLGGSSRLLLSRFRLSGTVGLSRDGPGECSQHGEEGAQDGGQELTDTVGVLKDKNDNNEAEHSGGDRCDGDTDRSGHP